MPNPVRLRYYYIDPSANQKAREATRGQKDFGYFFKRAQHWARRAVARLDDPTDTDFARVFNVIFKTPKNDVTPFSDLGEWQHRYGRWRDCYWLCTEGHVRSVLKDFSEMWAETWDRAAADVRFHSGDRGRLQHVGNWTYYDSTNRLQFSDVNGYKFLDEEQTISYRHSETAGILERMSNINPQILASHQGENPEKYVIDIGTDAWRGLARIDLDDFLGKEADFDSMDNILDDIISTSMTKLILHESLKAPPYLLKDANASNAGWSSVMQFKMGEAHHNAESLAVLALWAVLADTVPQALGVGGFTLDRTWDSIPGSRYDIIQIPEVDHQRQLKWQREYQLEPQWNASPWYSNLAREGAIIQYRDITGRRP
ncbi:hypothetical protein VPNG_07078 [Cytospora leucostoma]|uniref:Uncharacterized protein n=1 Tax=Cytospora leucostoma TaxID=1230097 RepID=A0A423WVL8_9PEZI|nr:hypothetical protein VPNG_07078 [Cytospora leucostoma]